MVRQGAPAIMSRNIALPGVKTHGEVPYVLASKFPNGAVCIATEGRAKPNQSWIHPRADIMLNEVDVNQPIGIFGHYNTLSLDFQEVLPRKFSVVAQDLLSTNAMDITEKVSISGSMVKISGELIDEIGTMENSNGDISVPGLVLKVMIRE